MKTLFSYAIAFALTLSFSQCSNSGTTNESDTQQAKETRRDITQTKKDLHADLERISDRINKRIDQIDKDLENADEKRKEKLMKERTSLVEERTKIENYDSNLEKSTEETIDEIQAEMGSTFKEIEADLDRFAKEL